MPQWEDRPLVGRDPELARLLASVDRAVAGHGSAVLLAGDAGVGKTRLLDELCARATARGVRVLTGHCVDLGDVGLPYLPFVDLLRPVAGDPATTGQPALEGLLAGRTAGPPPEPPAGDAADLGRPLPSRAIRIPADDGRLQLFESVAGLLAGLAAEAPLLLVVEDLHWADRSSRDLLRYLLARLGEEPVAVVASYRADDLHRRHPLRPLLAELVRLPGVERLELTPLPDPAVGQLVRDLAAGVPEATVDDVVARAEGNAFYAQELLAAGLAGESLPLGLTDVLLARVERLAPPAQQVLRAAAVAGRQVRHELVAAVSALSPADLEPALAEAVHSHLLVVSPDGRYRFRHALLREAVLADLLPGERVRLHAAVAAHLAADPAAGTAAERAHHARESNDLPTALTASLDAAADAARVGAPAEQLQHLEAALTLWPAVPDAAARAGRDHPVLLLEAAAAARAGGEVHRAVAFLHAARELLGPDGDRATLARVHYTLAQALGRIEDQAAAHRESTRAMELVPASPPSPARAWAAATHARTAYDLARWAEGDAAAEEALAAADALGLDSAWADTAVTLARARGGSTAVIAARLEEALARARRSGDRDVEMRVLFNLAVVPYEAGDVAGALPWIDTALTRAEDLGLPWTFYAAELRHLGVVARYVSGDWDGSLALAERLARVPEMAAHVRAAGLLVQVGRGDPAAAERVAWARGLSARLEAHVLLMLATAGAAIDLAAWAGDAEAAASEAETAERQLGLLWRDDRLAAVRLVATALSPVADAAAAARAAGDADAERRWVTRGEGLVARARSAVADHLRAIGGYGAEGAAWVARVDAEEARLQGRTDPELWRAAVRAFDYGHVYERARGNRRLAEALLATGDRDGAREALQEAADVAVRLGAEPLREAVAALARRGRLAVELPGLGRVPDAAAVFTPRELEVLGLLARGRTNRQIGTELYISEKTASVHVSNILAKLGAGSRTEAVALAAARGLLPEASAG